MPKKVLLLILLLSTASFAQVTLKIVSVPKNTPENAVIFVAGNFNNWSPNDSAFRLTQNYKGQYFIDLPTKPENYEFKFTLGSWNSTEMTAGGGDISNRKLFGGKDTAVSFTIENWKSLGSDAGLFNVPQAFVFSDNFPMNKQNKTRRVWVYLPSDYAASPNKRYPVLYMQDGQNIFSASTAANGEWEVDETLSELEKKGDFGVIVVAIDNGGSERIEEYSPWKNAEYGGGKGNEYLDFISYTLKPSIDLLYRTKPDRLHTGIMGSSLGALVALYAAFKYEAIFSKFGVFSPSLWLSDSIYRMPKITCHKYASKIYLMSGILESSTQAQETYNMRDTLLKYGFSPSEVRCEIKNDGTHSEWFWKREFAACYSWLFEEAKNGIVVLPSKSDLTQDFDMELSDNKSTLNIKTNGLTGRSLVVVKNESGRLYAQKHIGEKGYINLSKFRKGSYTVTLSNGNFNASKTFEKK
ncbi:MAG: hypothetical protein IPP32_01655 [Bacteroidetes bacterium]|nr:hypothetical protein [Bacteroidota bacterium]